MRKKLIFPVIVCILLESRRITLAAFVVVTFKMISFAELYYKSIDGYLSVLCFYVVFVTQYMNITYVTLP